MEEFGGWAFGYDAVGKEVEDVEDVKEVKDWKRPTADWGERWVREKLGF